MHTNMHATEPAGAKKSDVAFYFCISEDPCALFINIGRLLWSVGIPVLVFLKALISHEVIELTMVLPSAFQNIVLYIALN